MSRVHRFSRRLIGKEDIELGEIQHADSAVRNVCAEVFGQDTAAFPLEILLLCHVLTNGLRSISSSYLAHCLPQFSEDDDQPARLRFATQVFRIICSSPDNMQTIDDVIQELCRERHMEHLFTDVACMGSL